MGDEAHHLVEGQSFEALIARLRQPDESEIAMRNCQEPAHEARTERHHMERSVLRFLRLLDPQDDSYRFNWYLCI